MIFVPLWFILLMFIHICMYLMYLISLTCACSISLASTAMLPKISSTGKYSFVWASRQIQKQTKTNGFCVIIVCVKSGTELRKTRKHTAIEVLFSISHQNSKNKCHAWPLLFSYASCVYIFSIGGSAFVYQRVTQVPI